MIMERIKGKNSITKVVEVASMKVQPAKENPTKSLESDQEIGCDPRIVAFSKILHKIIIEDACYSNDKK